MLEVRDLVAGYATAAVLQGVTLDVGRGEAVALLGRNGMGKTTLLRAIAGLAPPIVRGGTIRLDGSDLLGRHSYEVARAGISLVPQGRRVFRSLDVEENLTIAARPRPDGWDLKKVYELFPRLGERRRQTSATLSGGEQQMLAIARSLMTNPKLLVMDEPSEGLAPSIHEVIRERVQHLKMSGQSFLLAEQNVDFALDVADRVTVLGASGTLAWEGAPDDLRQDQTILQDLVGLTG